MKKAWNGLLSLLLVLTALNLQPVYAQAQPPAPGNFCRFGIGVPKGLEGYDLSLLGVGSYLDWSAWRNYKVPSNIQFLNVVKVSDREYPTTLINMPYLLSQWPGGIWILGNEPDSEVIYQDHITAETFAERYYVLADLIRKTDPAAMIGFGPIIQPTPIRMYYLDLALARLNSLAQAGGYANASELIDIFTIHNFLLNESPMYRYDDQGKIIESIDWGTGVPRGYQAGVWPAPFVISGNELWKTHDAGLFETRIREFRAWMNARNFRSKPLWVTEYGSLLPWDGRTGSATVSEADTASFLKQTIDFMLTGTDPATGYAADGNRLVQHFTWYSLNEDVWRYGGALYNPENRSLTQVGQTYMNYDPPAGAEAAGLVRQPADLYMLPDSLTIYPLSPGSSPGLVNYRLILRASNRTASEYRTPARIDLSIEGGALLGQQAEILPRCSGQGVYSFVLSDRQPGETLTLSAQIFFTGSSGSVTNPGDDTQTFPPVSLPKLYQMFQPIVIR